MELGTALASCIQRINASPKIISALKGQCKEKLNAFKTLSTTQLRVSIEALKPFLRMHFNTPSPHRNTRGEGVVQSILVVAGSVESAETFTRYHLEAIYSNTTTTSWECLIARIWGDSATSKKQPPQILGSFPHTQPIIGVHH